MCIVYDKTPNNITHLLDVFCVKNNVYLDDTTRNEDTTDIFMILLGSNYFVKLFLGMKANKEKTQCDIPRMVEFFNSKYILKRLREFYLCFSDSKENYFYYIERKHR